MSCPLLHSGSAANVIEMPPAEKVTTFVSFTLPSALWFMKLCMKLLAAPSTAVAICSVTANGNGSGAAPEEFVEFNGAEGITAAAPASRFWTASFVFGWMAVRFCATFWTR